MKRFRIEYRNDHIGPADFVGVVHVRAYDLDHAIEKFNDSDDGAGWVILSVKRVRS